MGKHSINWLAYDFDKIDEQYMQLWVRRCLEFSNEQYITKNDAQLIMVESGDGFFIKTLKGKKTFKVVIYEVE